MTAPSAAARQLWQEIMEIHYHHERRTDTNSNAVKWNSSEAQGSVCLTRALDAERAKALEEATEFVWGKSGHSREECDCQMCAIARALRARAAEVRR